MRHFEIFVGEAASLAYPAQDTPPASAAPCAPPSGTRRTARQRPREVLDVFIGGANVTARVTESQASAVVRDLGVALRELAALPSGKRLVRFYDAPWELCVERFGRSAALSVYRAGAEPQVAVYDERAPFAEVFAAVRDAVGAAVGRGSAPAAVALELIAVEAALAQVAGASLEGEQPCDVPSTVSVDLDRDVPLAIGADLAIRAPHDASSVGSSAVSAGGATIEHSDLHALLFRGHLRAEVRGRAVDLGVGHPFLFAERLLMLATRALEAWEQGAAQFARATGGGVVIGVRVGPEGGCSLTLGGYTFPALAVPDVVEGALSFGRALARAVLRRDRSQCMNLRLSAFRRALRETGDALREVCRADAKINPTPEPYRAFLTASANGNGGVPLTSAARLRYVQRWRALVPGIDLRSTFLCGEHLVVGAALETFCLDRKTGEIAWRTPTERATSVVTPGGIARILGDGRVEVLDFGTGETTLRTRIEPRLGGPPAGAVVNVPGLPRLLIVTEGERHLVAVDLASGERRWRFAWGRGGVLRMKRAGRLLYVAGGDSALTALDVQTGAVVWRARNRLRFRTLATLDHDTLFAVAGGQSSQTELCAFDPWSGRERWRTSLGGPMTVEGAPLVAGDVVACAVRDRHGLRLVARDRANGDLAWQSEGTVAPIGTSWLGVDDLLIGNSPTGELSAIEARSGALRYRHVLGRVLDADIPRRLEPVLRSGALFVPHVDVHVFRPRDGAPLATIGPCDAIPDLLRVDEKCDVYVAEESGHVVSFGVGPRLTLVK